MSAILVISDVVLSRFGLIAFHPLDLFHFPALQSTLKPNPVYTLYHLLGMAKNIFEIKLKLFSYVLLYTVTVSA